MNAADFLQIADRFGVPVALLIVMILLLIWFAAQHRAERAEWRDFMQAEIKNWRSAVEAESKLTREAIDTLRAGFSELAESFAFLSWMGSSTAVESAVND